MKKHFLVASMGIALIALAISFSSCKKDDKEIPIKPPKKTTVEKLIIEPTEISLTVGEKKEFTVSIEPLGTKYNANIDNTKIATLEGMTVVAVAEGTTTLTVKAGNKTANMKITVTKKIYNSKDKIGGDIYFTNPENLENEHEVIYSTMRSLGWTSELNGEETENSPEFDGSYVFFKDRDPEQDFVFDSTRYFYKPKKGDIKFGVALGYYEPDFDIYNGIFYEGFEKDDNNFCQIYGLTYVRRSTVEDNIPCVILKKNSFPEIDIVCFAKTKNFQGMEVTELTMQFYKKLESNSQSDIPKVYDFESNIKIPSKEAIKASTKMIKQRFKKKNTL